MSRLALGPMMAAIFIILLGTAFVPPAILGYTALAYTVFRGKATELR